MERLMRKQDKVRNVVIMERGGHTIDEVKRSKNDITQKTKWDMLVK